MSQYLGWDMKLLIFVYKNNCGIHNWIGWGYYYYTTTSGHAANLLKLKFTCGFSAHKVVCFHKKGGKVCFVGAARSRLSQLRLKLLPLSGITFVSRPVNGSSKFGTSGDLSMVFVMMGFVLGFEVFVFMDCQWGYVSWIPSGEEVGGSRGVELCLFIFVVGPCDVYSKYFLSFPEVRFFVRGGPGFFVGCVIDVVTTSPPGSISMA